MYRDSFEKCPRCAVELTDARSARGCRSCGGLWVEEHVLSEMVLEMLPPGSLSRLQLAAVSRAEPAIACPTCGDRMEQTEIHQARIDRCSKHGVWFDREELQQALHRIGRDGLVAAPVAVIEPMPVARELVEPTLAPTSPPVASAAETAAPSWSDDPRMNDRQGLGLGPGVGPWRPYDGT